MFKKTRLFKKYDYESYSIIPINEVYSPALEDKPPQYTFVIHKLTPATSWPDYITQVVKCSREGTGYKVERYKRQGYGGIKKVIPNIQKKFRVLSTARGSKKEQLSSLKKGQVIAVCEKPHQRLSEI